MKLESIPLIDQVDLTTRADTIIAHLYDQILDYLGVAAVPVTLFDNFCFVATNLMPYLSPSSIKKMVSVALRIYITPERSNRLISVAYERHPEHTVKAIFETMEYMHRYTMASYAYCCEASYAYCCEQMRTGDDLFWQACRAELLARELEAT